MEAKILLLALLALIYSSVSSAADPDPLQDFCVADFTSSVFVNGVICKNPNLVKADDFYLGGLELLANTSNSLGMTITPAFIASLPGLNTLGLSMLRIDYAPGGVYPPHLHPRASEILLVLKGKLEVGFIASHGDNRLFTKSLRKGDVFVFPQGLVQYHHNIGKSNAIAITALNSQNPGVVFIPSTLFGSIPKLPTAVLAKSFEVDADVISKIKANF